MQQPKISIIIPSFNQGQFIEETIRSITAQSYKNTEILIIDGGSTDTTIDVIKKHETSVTYWISEKDSGQSDAINKGLLVASGELVTWLNSDDYFEPGALQTVVDLFEKNPLVDILHGKSRLFGDKIQSKIVGLNQDLPLHNYLAYMRFPQPSSFFKKEFLGVNFPVNERLHYAMDFELVARAILAGATIKRTDHLLSHYRLHPGSKSNHAISFLNEWALVVHGIFNSLNHGKVYSEKLETLGLVNINDEPSFNAKIAFTDTELESIFLEHLNLHYHTHYRLFHYDACARISRYLKENYNSFYLKNNYNRFNFRLKFIPEFMFDLLRKL